MVGNVDTSTKAASALAAIGLAMDPVEFVAGLGFALLAAIGGRMIWKAESQRGFLSGLYLALIFAIFVAFLHSSIGAYGPVAVWMGGAGFLVIPLKVELRKRGFKFTGQMLDKIGVKNDDDFK